MHKTNIFNMTPEFCEFYDKWTSLSPEKKKFIIQTIDYIKQKRSLEYKSRDLFFTLQFSKRDKFDGYTHKFDGYPINLTGAKERVFIFAK